MDVAKEITKLESKKEKLNGQLGKLREAMEIADYVTKVQHFQRKRFLSRGNVQLNSSLRSVYCFLTLFAPLQAMSPANEGGRIAANFNTCVSKPFRCRRMFNNKILKRYHSFDFPSRDLTYQLIEGAGLSIQMCICELKLWSSKFC